MRASCNGVALCVLLGIAATVSAQKPLTLEGLRDAMGGSGQVKFKQIDTSKAIAPIPTYGQPKRSFSLMSLIPSWMRPGASPAQPTTMRSVKRASSQSVNTNPSSAFQPTQPFAVNK